MAERPCRKCGEPYYAERGTRYCPDCIGERGPRDVVTELGRSEAQRLHKGLTEIQRAGR